MNRLSAQNRDRETFSGHVVDGWLHLDRPVYGIDKLYAGVRFDGQRVDLDGTLVGICLTGAANVMTNEPIYNGAAFVNFAGQSLTVLNLGPALKGMHDTILVLDPAQGKAFAGGFGGDMPPGMSDFHGYRCEIALREATAYDRAAFKRCKTLVTLANRSDEIAVEAWHYDTGTGRIYTTLTIGEHTDVVEVIDCPPEVRLAA